MSALRFTDLRVQNLRRCRRWHPEGAPPWKVDDWLLALGGEVGEALNVVRKLNRDRDGLAGNTRSRDDLLADLGDELADGVIYLDIAVGWQNAAVLLGSSDFAERRDMRRQSEDFHVMIADGSGLGLRLLRAVAAINEYSLATAGMRAFDAFDRLADHYSIDLGDAVIRKFNATSERFGFPERLAA